MVIRKRRRKSQENSVLNLIMILEKEIEPAYGNKRKFLRKNGIHRKVDNKYHKILYNIILFLEEEKGANHNSLNSLIKDYLDSVYRYYWQWKRTPTVNQMSPAANNRIRFNEYIQELERNDELYWIAEKPKKHEVYEFEDDFDYDVEISEV